MLGYPGSGKTTTAKFIEEQTGAVHLWADHERREMFGMPKHSPEESKQLYEHLNAVTERLLDSGQSVIFDTNFNYYSDRQHLREIAAKHGADCKLLWVVAPEVLARKRATEQPEGEHTRVLGTMTNQEFETLVAKLEPPTKDETFIKIDGTKLNKEHLTQQIGLA